MSFPEDGAILRRRKNDRKRPSSLQVSIRSVEALAVVGFCAALHPGRVVDATAAALVPIVGAVLTCAGSGLDRGRAPRRRERESPAASWMREIPRRRGSEGPAAPRSASQTRETRRRRPAAPRMRDPRHRRTRNTRGVADARDPRRRGRETQAASPTRETRRVADAS